MVQDDVILPLKIDAYPRVNRDEIEVWIIGGRQGNEAYQGFYDPVRRSRGIFDLSKQNTDQSGSFLPLSEVSVGESGVWGIDTDGRVRYYDLTPKRWLPVSDTDARRKWRFVESGSDNNVYAIEQKTSTFYFRAGITEENPRGDKWISTGLRASQVSTSPYITYLVSSDDNKLNSFTIPPNEENLKIWVTSLKTHDVNVKNKFSVGFDNTLVYLDNAGLLKERDLVLSMEDEQFDSKWRWLKYNVRLTDVSSGPVVFGIYKGKIIAKQSQGRFSFQRHFST